MLAAHAALSDAEHEIEEGLQRRPDSAFGHFLQGLLYSRTGRPELAEKSLQSALQLDPKMSQAYLQLVNLYLQQKRTPEAIRQLEAYLKAFPDSPYSPKARETLKRLQGNTGAPCDLSDTASTSAASAAVCLAPIRPRLLAMINFSYPMRFLRRLLCFLCLVACAAGTVTLCLPNPRTTDNRPTSS